jgi:trimeric autotransporter adhesin
MKLRIGCLVVGFLLSVLSVAAQTSGSGAVSDAAPAVTGTGTEDYVPLWLSSTELGSSKLFQSTAGKVGIGTKTPAATLDVNGTVNAATSFNLGGTRFAFGSYSDTNAFLGFAGNTKTTGTANTASGVQALYSVTGGSVNTANGNAALYSNTTGSYNTAIGSIALYANTTGSFNTATGTTALFQNTTGSPNDVFGYQALYSNTTASYNDAFGYQALYSNNDPSDSGILASYNDAFGYQALYSNTVGAGNAAFGFQALYSNVGDSSGDGGYNTAVGQAALYMNNDTSDGIVYAANNTAVGSAAMYYNSTGYNNTAVGSLALSNNTTGSDLTCIGYGCVPATDGLKNATAIGAHAVVGASNSLVLGGTGDHAVKVGIGTITPSNILTIGRGMGHPVSDSWETYSSRRWKTNIQTLPDALSKVEQLRGVSYDLKDSGKHEIGVIAEEVGKVVPEVVSYEDNGKDARGVDYSRLTALLIEATKEQQSMIRKQQQQTCALQAQLKVQQARAKLQDAQIAELMSQVRTIQVSLKTNGHRGTEVRTLKAQVPIVQQ